jgi:serine/threonine-protein kinase RsbW
MGEERVSYRLSSNLDSAKQAEDAALEFAARSGFESHELLEIAIAVREAVTNAVLHGNAFHPDKIVQVTFERDPGMLKITVGDQGSGFNPEQARDPWAPENLLKESGRGIPLMRATMDEIHCRRANPGTEMVLIKRLRYRPLMPSEK